MTQDMIDKMVVNSLVKVAEAQAHEDTRQRALAYVENLKAQVARLKQENVKLASQLRTARAR